MTNLRSTISQLLQSQLGLLLITSVVVPLVAFSYRAWRDHVEVEASAAIEKRIIVYRMDIIAHSLGRPNYADLCRAYAALQGKTGCYQPVFPELETNIPLTGLIYRVLPEGTLIDEGYPEPVETLELLAGALLPVVGPEASKADFTKAYAEQAHHIKTLQERLLTQYPQLKSHISVWAKKEQAERPE